MDSKSCTICGKVQPIDQFYMKKSQSKKSLGLYYPRAECKTCHHTHAKARGPRPQYVRVTERRETLLARQGGVCALCGTSDCGTTWGWHLDHDHSCCPGKTTCGSCDRGVLCRTCNMNVIGVTERYLRLIPKAFAYLGLTWDDALRAVA